MTLQQIQARIKQHRQLLPLLLLTGFCIEAINEALLNYSLLTIKNYIAFGVIALNFLTYSLLRRFYKYTLAVTIIVGLFNLIVFSAVEWTTSISFNSLEVSFQPQAFLAGLLAYLINFKRVNNFLLDNIGTKQTPEERENYEKAIFAEETEKFKERYKNYSNETLTEIITENKYVPGALEAARQLLHERRPKENNN